MSDTKKVQAALTAGVREALVRHVRENLPVVEWQDGKIVWLQPAEIKKRIKEIDARKKR